MKMFLSALTCIGVVATCLAIPSGKVTTTVRVVSPEGEPVPAAQVGLSYARVLERDAQEDFEGRTDESGEVQFTGRAESFTHVELRTPGYYYAYEKVRSYDFEAESDKRIFPDRTIELVAKEIRDPIVMVATRDRFLVPREHAEGVGLDLMRGDWVAPLGKGEVADVVFQIEHSRETDGCYETTLRVSFPNPGDGLIAFYADPDQGSILRSDHLAPAEGYVAETALTRGLYRIAGAGNAGPQKEYRGDQGEERNYYLRLRSRLDQEGNVIEARYGKVYGDFRVFGELAPEGYTLALGSCYYLNPNPNDRNVEAVPGETLMEGVSRLDLPNRP